MTPEYERREFRGALEIPSGTYSARSESPAQRVALNATTLGAGLLPSALRAVAVGCDRPEYGPITTDRGFRLPEAFVAETGMCASCKIDRQDQQPRSDGAYSFLSSFSASELMQ